MHPNRIHTLTTQNAELPVGSLVQLRADLRHLRYGWGALGWLPPAPQSPTATTTAPAVRVGRVVDVGTPSLS